jgi:hypothetical protein
VSMATIKEVWMTTNKRSEGIGHSHFIILILPRIPMC